MKWVPLLLLLLFAVTQSAQGDEIMQSDSPESLLIYQMQGWGSLGINTAVVPPDGRQPMPLKMAGKSYEKGLGTHAPSEMVLSLDGRYSLFEALVGIQDQGNPVGSVIFQVYVDEEKCFDSGVIHEGEVPKLVSVKVEGGQVLRLVVTDAGDGTTCDCANWADCRLTPSSVNLGLKADDAKVLSVDLAPFARVVTSDPERLDGARSNRVQEFAPEDVFLDSPVPSEDGIYLVPAWKGQTGCIGLQWPERRLLKRVILTFDGPEPPAAVNQVQLQYWTGESPWQGKWEIAQGKIEAQGLVWTYTFGGENPLLPGTGTEKIRWIWPQTSQGVRVKGLAAYGFGALGEVALRVETEPGFDEENGRIEVYNGQLLTTGSSGLALPWDLQADLFLKVRYTRALPWKSDRTILSFQTPRGGFGVAVEDVLKNKRVYVRDYGVYVTLASEKTRLAEYKTSIEGEKKVLTQVREMPDQTFAAAIEHVHNPVQDDGPMMLSLACDNWKFAVHREGKIQFDIHPDDPHQSWGAWQPAWSMTPQYGTGGQKATTRSLIKGWYPLHSSKWSSEDGVEYSQLAFVAPWVDPATASMSQEVRPLCIISIRIKNTAEKTAQASISLLFEGNEPFTITDNDTLTNNVVKVGDRPIVGIHSLMEPILSSTSSEKGIRWTGEISAHEEGSIAIAIPGWIAQPGENLMVEWVSRLISRTKKYWEESLSNAMQVETPDPLLNNIIKASQVHCLLAARNDPADGTAAPWISSDRYGPLESEANSIILGMARMGQTEFARKSLDYFIKQYNPQGFLTTGYTLMGTGWHLWTLAEYYRLTQDKEWLEKHASEIARVCKWIVAQTDKTKRKGFDGNTLPEYGLFPPGVAADWNRFAYRFALQGHFLAGLRDAGMALQEIHYPGAEELVKAAETFKEDLFRAYRWNQARTPVVPLQDGTFVPASPSILYAFGPSGDIFPGEDGNRSWCYDVELGANHLAAMQVMDPMSPEAGWALDYLEDVRFLQSGMGDYLGEKSQADWFNLAGFSKVQPYYTRAIDVYAQRDDVKPFIRSYFNAIPSLLSLENLSFWEHFHNIGGWNKTHETGWFLSQTRTLFLMERGEELWLAPFVTNNWLKPDQKVSVANAPTRFGPVSYEIVSSSDKGFIEATVQCPIRTSPNGIVLRVRHPEGKPMKSVLVDGASHKAFDPGREIIRLKPTGGKVGVKVMY